jgi:hypothetical protein
MCHHAIVVTSWKIELLIEAHAEAVALGTRDPGSPFGRRLWEVSELTPESTNGYRSFFVAPDGSKEGWDTSDAGDGARQQFIDWLDAQRYEDGSTSLSWVVVAFGEDDHKPPAIIRDGGQYQRDHPWTEADDEAWAAREDAT